MNIPPSPVSSTPGASESSCVHQATGAEQPRWFCNEQATQVLFSHTPVAQSSCCRHSTQLRPAPKPASASVVPMQNGASNGQPALLDGSQVTHRCSRQAPVSQSLSVRHSTHDGSVSPPVVNGWTAQWPSSQPWLLSGSHSTQRSCTHNRPSGHATSLAVHSTQRFSSSRLACKQVVPPGQSVSSRHGTQMPAGEQVGLPSMQSASLTQP